MRLVFVRHGRKVVNESLEDEELLLATEATKEVHALARALAARDLTPRVIVSSRYRHALDTSELLRGTRTRHLIPVTALTPHTPDSHFTMSTIVSEAVVAGVDLFRDCDVLMLVGHETRLSQLAATCAGLPREGVPELSGLEALVLEWRGTILERFDPKDGGEDGH